MFKTSKVKITYKGIFDENSAIYLLGGKSYQNTPVPLNIVHNILLPRF